MANRFIDTGFYRSPFVRSLQGAYKSLYSFIICDCNNAGIWAKDIELAILYLKQDITDEGFEEFFVGPGKAVDLKNGKYFFPDFIEHQYPKGLSDKNPAHNNVILELKKYKLFEATKKELVSPSEGTKVMVMEKGKVMEEEKEKGVQGEKPKVQNSELSETEKQIADYFGFTEQNNFKQIAAIANFYSCLVHKKRIDYFKEQFPAYVKFKSENPKYKHNFQNFLGSQELFYEDGGWCAENWVEKLKGLNGAEVKRKSSDSGGKKTFVIPLNL